MKTIIKNNGNRYNWEEIDDWRQQGMSYNSIRKTYQEKYGRPGPVKSTLSYRYSTTTKDRVKQYKKNMCPYKVKISRVLTEFKKKEKSVWKPQTEHKNTIERRIHYALIAFKKKGGKDVKTFDYNLADALKYLEDKQSLNLDTKTAISPLTGETIDLTKQFHLDHWDNNSGNELENLALLSREENMLKGAFSISDLVSICKKVIKLHG